ncbi:gamma-glutamyltransferase [Azospirillum sp. TSH58]|uniref:gamma-glutamyltransferase n=1 Tax=Azospirillum sp. TSH58 TaxID=664962 RepID=UPI0020002F55|nr:gamma-glutamyltransferase [Azospirillum sp. TSH58]
MTETSLLGLRTVSSSAHRGTGQPVKMPVRAPHSTRRIWQGLGAIAIAASLVGGCVNTKYRTGAPAQSFVAADEPRAAEIGRDIIAQGGKAGDAAAAMAMAMAVTLPSRVGMTGGGVCVVFDAAKKETRTLDFLPRSTGTGGAALPGFLRGVYALQAATGAMRWEQAVVPAEQLARSTPVSRALARDLADSGARLSADPEARRVFLPTGAPLAEGAPLSQPELAATLSQVRRSGIAAMYGGPLGGAVAQAAAIDPAAVRGFQPRWTGTAAIPLGIVSMHFAQLPETSNGAALTAAWNAAADLPSDQRAARVAQALGATGNGASAPGAGLVVIDHEENGVACSFTMGAPFGAGRMVPGTGLLAARGVDGAGFGAPGLLTNAIVGRTQFAGAASAAGNDGPAAAPAALLTAALPAALDKEPGAAIRVSRATAGPGRATFVTCQTSMESGWKECQVAADPRAHALGILVETER